MFYVLQEGKKDCGFACLKVLLANVNNDSNYLYLPNPKAEDEAYSFYELIEYASNYGFTLSAYSVSDKENLSLENGLPMLVSISKEGKAHMVMLYKVSKKYVYYFDPSCGKRKMDKESFIDCWNGKLLKFDEFKKKKCAIKRKRLLTNKEELVMDLLEIVAGISITLGLFFTQEKYPFFLPIILFAVFAISEVLLRSYCLYVYRRIDERVYNDSLKVKKGMMKEFFITLENNKQYEVMINLNSIYAVLSVVVIALFLYVSGGFSLYYLLFGLFFAFIEVTFLEPYLLRKNNEISELENTICDDDLGLIKVAHQKAYRYGRISLLYRYVVLGISLLGIVLIMGMSGVISIPYIIFYLCLNIFFYKNLVTGLGMNQRVQKHRQSIVHQINLIDN